MPRKRNTAAAVARVDEDSKEAVASIDSTWLNQTWATTPVASGISIGVDFGTSNSCVAWWSSESGRAKVIKDEAHGKAHTIPSAVCFGVSPPAIGADAMGMLARYPTQTILNAKRFLGRSPDDPFVEREAASMATRVVPTADGEGVAFQVEAGQPAIKPEDIATRMFMTMKAMAERKIRKPVSNAVITVPAYYSLIQKTMTRNAATAAGLNVLQIVSEPTAAAMAYGLFVAGSKQALVVDLGGGTLDVSLLRIRDGALEVMGTNGETTLGGENFTHKLMDLVASKLGFVCDRATQDPAFLSQVRTACEAAKIKLSDEPQVTISIPSYAPVTVTTAEFNAACQPLVKQCVATVMDVLHRANVPVSAVQEVVLVGGGSRAPCVRRALGVALHNEDLCCVANPEEVVAIGAAIQAAILCGVDHELLKDRLMVDVTPRDWGIEGPDGEMQVIIPRNTRYPVVMSRQFENLSKKAQGISLDFFEGNDAVARNNSWIGHGEFPARPGSLLTVSFALDKYGAVRVDVNPVNAADAAHVSTRPSSNALLLYILILMGIYLIVKMLFAEERQSWNSGSDL